MERKWREITSGETEYGEKVTRECFFLEDRSSVVSYKLSTKFRRHGTFTSFFTVWRRRDNAGVMSIYIGFHFFPPPEQCLLTWSRQTEHYILMILRHQTYHINGEQSFQSGPVLMSTPFLFWGVRLNALTAATGTSISTKSPANECLMSLSFTSRKYCAHSCGQREGNKERESEKVIKKHLCICPLLCFAMDHGNSCNYNSHQRRDKEGN